MGRLDSTAIGRIADGRTVYVETGLWAGDQIAETLASGAFDTIYGIELDAHWAQHCRRRFADQPAVRIIEGDTLQHLPELVDRIRVPAVFLLDAHYFLDADPPVTKGHFPLWEELDLLAGRDHSDIVIVDDVHTFARPRPDLAYDDGTPEWEAVTTQVICDRLGRVARHWVEGDGLILERG